MERLYIDNDMARFTRKSITQVDVELYDGRKFEDLEPRRLFPVSGLEKYIALLDKDGAEKAIIRDLRTLPPQERATIESCLNEYYLVPKVEKITGTHFKFGVLTMQVETDRGASAIEIRNILHGIKLLSGYRVLLRDGNDNRYEISDIRKLDKQSRQLIDQFL